MNAKFSYEKVSEHFFGTIRRPIAQVSFKAKGQDIWVKTWMIVDTGADFSILPRYYAKDLGISFSKDCIKNATIGVGGQTAVYLYKSKMEARIGTLKRKVPIAFFDSNEIPALLGRLGFMETFDMEFLKTHTVVFKD